MRWHHFFPALLCIFFSAKGWSGWSFIDKGCKDIVLELKEQNIPEEERDHGEGKSRNVTLFLDCHEGNDTYPEQTTINYFTYRRGEVCHGHRVCGNVLAFRGEFTVGARIFTGMELAKFLKKIANTEIGAETKIEFKLGFDYIRRFCSKMQDWDCLPVGFQ